MRGDKSRRHRCFAKNCFATPLMVRELYHERLLIDRSPSARRRVLENFGRESILAVRLFYPPAPKDIIPWSWWVPDPVEGALANFIEVLADNT
jgi:hypothetical protein